MNDDQQKRAFINRYLANGVPALLSAFVVDAIFTEQEVRIVEHHSGHLKIDAIMLADVRAFLLGIPFEPHRTYIV